MLRTLVIVLLIFTSLSAQVSTAYACSMTGQVVMHDCCCDDDADAPDLVATPQAEDPGRCCQPLTLIGDAAGGVDAAAQATARPPPADAEQAVLLVAALSLFGDEAHTEAPHAAHPPGAAPGAGTRTWLQTQRLRI